MRRLDGFDHDSFGDSDSHDSGHHGKSGPHDGHASRQESAPAVSLGDFDSPAGSSSPDDFGDAGWSLGFESHSPALDSPRSFFLPLHYEASYQYPLIVWLHCDGFNEHQVEQVMPHISLRNYLAVGVRGVRAADAMGHRFEWPQSAGSVQATWRQVSSVIEETKSRFSVHPDRVILAGYGRGGTMALRLAMRQPEAFGGVISLGGRLPSRGRLFSDLETLRKRRLPMLWQWAVQGDHFESQGLAEDLRKMMVTNSKIEVRQYHDHDEMNTVTLADINTWVMRSVVNGSVCQTGEPNPSLPSSFSAN